MKKVNDFQKKRIDRILESVNILKALKTYNLKQSLSLDTFNANIRFQIQYISEHISTEISSIDKTHKTYNAENNTVLIQYDEITVIHYNFMDKEYKITTKK